MRSSVAAADVGTPQQTLPSPSGLCVKAFLRPIARDVIQRGKQSSAATEIGISEGRLSSKLGDGTLSLGELEKLGPEVAVTFAEEVLKRLGPLCTPHARVRQSIRNAKLALDEAEQLLEYIA